MIDDNVPGSQFFMACETSRNIIGWYNLLYKGNKQEYFGHWSFGNEVIERFGE